MKLDSGHVVFPGSVGHNVECIPVEYANAAFDSAKPKFVKGNDKENQNGLLSDIKGRKVESNQLECQVDNVGGWTESGHEQDFGKSYLSDGSEKAVGEYVVAMSPSHPCVKPQSFEDSLFYVDRSVMERELPEVIVYKENTYQVVKDICIDEGLPSQNKFLLESDVDKKSLSTILHPEKETSSQMIGGNEDPDAPVPGAFKSPIEKTDLCSCPPDEMVTSHDNDSQCDLSISSNCKASRPTGDGRDDINQMGANVLSKDNWSLRDLLSMRHWGTELSWPKSSSDHAEESKLHSFQKVREDSLSEMDPAHSNPQNDNQEVTLAEPRLVSVAEGLDNGTEGVSPKVSVVSEPDHTAEELEIAHPEMDTESASLASEFKDLDDFIKGASHPNELTRSSLDESARHSKIETGGIALDFNSPAPVSNCEKPGPQRSDTEHLEAQNASGLQSGGHEPSSSHPRYSQGETSFSDAVPFSGLITYTGPIAYSGSLSLRSDSSTTSTRSFAFPVLQSDWNSSPVRMAKADRKHLSRHRRWRHGLLCCKF